MKRMLYRLIAYLVAGAFLGVAGWLALFAGIADNNTPVAIILALAAFGLICAGLLLKRSRMVIENGIRVNTSWNVVAMDGVCIIAATTVSLFLIDGYSSWFSGSSPLLGSDPYAMDVVLVMYLPSALVLALFVTSTGSQIVTIDAKGLVIAGAFGVENVEWANIEKLVPDEQYVIVSRVGIPMPRHLRTNLEVTTNDHNILTVYQPGLKSTSKIILEKFRQCAPPSLQDDLDTIETAWL
jgi:hypothetical protein